MISARICIQLRLRVSIDCFQLVKSCHQPWQVHDFQRGIVLSVDETLVQVDIAPNGIFQQFFTGPQLEACEKRDFTRLRLRPQSL